jgi:hypothetical protein
LLTHKLENKMCFDWVIEYNKHINDKLIPFKTRMDHLIFQPFHLILGAHMVFNIVIMERGKPPCTLVVALHLEQTFSSQSNVIQKWNYRPITFKVLRSQDIMITPYLQSLSLTYNNEQANINAEIKHEGNILKYVSKPTIEFTFYSIRTYIPPATTKVYMALF